MGTPTAEETLTIIEELQEFQSGILENSVGSILTILAYIIVIIISLKIIKKYIGGAS